MSFQNEPQPNNFDDDHNRDLSDAAGDESVSEATPEIRIARILDYQATALTKPDSLEACVGACNADLMKIDLYLASTISQAIEKAGASTLNQLFPALDMQLRVARQIERFAQFETRVAETRKKAKSTGSSERRPPFAGPQNRQTH